MTPLSLPHSYDLTIRVMKQSGSLNHYFFISIFFKVVPPKAKLTGLCLIKKIECAWKWKRRDVYNVY